MIHMDKLGVKGPKFQQYLLPIYSLKMLCEHNHALKQKAAWWKTKKSIINIRGTCKELINTHDTNPCCCSPCKCPSQRKQIPRRF